MLKNKVIATARCHPKEKVDNRGVAEGEDGYFNGTTDLPVGIHSEARLKKMDDTTMKARRSTVKHRMTESKAFFNIFKLPALLITPILGFIIEFLYELPFMLFCLGGSRSKK